MVIRVLKRKKVSGYKFRKILKLFSLDLTAKQIAEIVGLNRNTINRYLRFIREQIAQICERESPFNGEIEVDESFFGAKHIKGKRGRGAYGKTIVFGIFKRNGKVYTEIVPDCARSTLQAVIRGRVSIDSIIHSDKWRGYNGLVDLGYKKHFRVDHGKNEFARKSAHINGIEGFWGFAKSRLSKFKGIHRSTIYLHLKECEFRFNYRNEDLYQKLLTIFKV
jgi:transposase-like protein